MNVIISAISSVLFRSKAHGFSPSFKNVIWITLSLLVSIKSSTAQHLYVGTLLEQSQDMKHTHTQIAKPRQRKEKKTEVAKGDEKEKKNPGGDL